MKLSIMQWRLPVELLLLVFDLSRRQDVMRASCVSRRWRRAAMSHSKFYIKVGYCCTRVGPRVISAFKAASIDHLPIAISFCRRRFGGCVHRHLDGETANERVTLTTIHYQLTQAFPFVRKLTFSGEAVSDVNDCLRVLTECPAPQLRKLEVIRKEADEDELEWPLDLFQGTAPHFYGLKLNFVKALPPVSVSSLINIRILEMIEPDLDSLNRDLSLVFPKLSNFILDAENMGVGALDWFEINASLLGRLHVFDFMACGGDINETILVLNKLIFVDIPVTSFCQRNLDTGLDLAQYYRTLGPSLQVTIDIDQAHPVDPPWGGKIFCTVITPDELKSRTIKIGEEVNQELYSDVEHFNVLADQMVYLRISFMYLRFLIQSVAELPVLRELCALVPPSNFIRHCPVFPTTDVGVRPVFAPALREVILRAENTSWDQKKGQIWAEELRRLSRDLGLHYVRKEMRPRLKVENDVTLVGRLSRRHFTGFSKVRLDWQHTSVLVPEAASRHHCW